MYKRQAIGFKEQVSPYKDSKTQVKSIKKNIDQKVVVDKDVVSIPKKQKIPQEVLDYKSTLIELYVERINYLDERIKITKLMSGAVNYKIRTTEDMFVESEGYKLGNPDSSDAVNYINGLYKLQLNLDKKSLENYGIVIVWLDSSLKDQKENLAKLDNITTMEDLKAFSVALNSSEVEFKKLEQSSDEWLEYSRKRQLELDGILNGISSRYSGSNSSNSKPVITSPSQPTYTPSSDRYKVKCISSKTFIGDVETKCY